MNRSLIVLGAGSSKSVHPSFPIGTELAQLIDVHLLTTKKDNSDPNNQPDCPYISSMINELKRVLQFDQSKLDNIIDILKRELWDYVQDSYYKFTRGKDQEISIDELIDRIDHRERESIVKVAKFCIAYHIKGQELAFHSCSDQSPSHLRRTWVSKLLRRVGLNHSLNDFLDNVRVISFNYDRLFEEIANSVISSAFNPPSDSLHSNINNIHYIYGNIGTLHDIPINTSNDNTAKMAISYKSIRLIGEGVHKDQNVDYSNIDTVLFIGFGYNSKNLQELFTRIDADKVQSFGMCYSKKTDHIRSMETKYHILIDQYAAIDDFVSDHFM